MRRVFDEISDDEWDEHQDDFKPSRIFKKPKPSTSPPPPIESFAYRPKPKPDPSAVVNVSDEDGDDDWSLDSEEEDEESEEEELNFIDDEDDDDVTVVKSKSYKKKVELALPACSSRGQGRFVNSDFVETRKGNNLEDDDDDDDWDDFEPAPPPQQSVVHDLEDDDVELEDDVKPGRALPHRRGRGRRKFLIYEEDSDVNGVLDDDDDDDEDGGGDDEEEEFEYGRGGGKGKENGRGDVVGNALAKCARISAELKKELYGSSSATSMCESYAEVEVSTSSVRIVTQEDVDAACRGEESDFEPTLKPYQIVGVNFLLLLYRKCIGGAILADEMGLGKTVQAVTYLTLLKHLDNDSGPHLIVCPASLLENWERELKRWCPSFTVILFHGAGRNIYSKELSSLSKSGLPLPFNVVLVCYSLFERRSAQQKDDRKILKRWHWSCVLMDEAHAMKDKNSFRWKNLMSVAKNARQRLMLTGTPLQNDLHELWSLLEFMMPDIFETGDVELKKLLSVEDSGLILRIKSILGPFILRRLKSDVMQQLVPKIQQVQYVVMGREQSAAYKDAIDEYRAASRARLSKLSTGSSSNAVGFLPKRQISNYFVQFRKIANHPLLVRRIYSDEDVVRIAKMLYPKGVFGFECSVEKAIQELKTYNDFSVHQLLVLYADAGAKALTDGHVLGSAKCQALAELLPHLRNGGHRVLIFSQWTQMMDILEWTLEVIGVTYKRLDGSTQVTERQTIVDTFNNNPSIFACLLSTRAGGQGLNLIGADTVIIHDMDFNPQMDRQAEDRCHRIGQIKPVTIYRLVTKNTVDENIYEIARRKLVLDAAVLKSQTELDNDNDVPEKTMGEILSSLLLV